MIPGGVTMLMDFVCLFVLSLSLCEGIFCCLCVGTGWGVGWSSARVEFLLIRESGVLYIYIYMCVCVYHLSV